MMTIVRTADKHRRRDPPIPWTPPPRRTVLHMHLSPVAIPPPLLGAEHCCMCIPRRACVEHSLTCVGPSWGGDRHLAQKA